MKIAIFTPSFLPKCSGAEIFHHNLATHLVAAGHEPVLIIPRRNVRQLIKSPSSLPYKFIGFPANLWSLFKRSPWLTYQIANICFDQLQARHRFDIWHVVMTYPTGVAALHWGGGKSRVPIVLRVAGDDLLFDKSAGVGLRCNPLIDRLVTAELPKARGVISLSDSITAEYQRIGIPAERIEWIPNAVELKRFVKSTPESNVFTFLSVGRNHPQKDYPTLLKAVVQVSEMRKNFRVLIVGRDSWKLKETIEAMGLSQYVFPRELRSSADFREFPPEGLVDLYLSADSFVMSSLMEGFSTALLEAMAAGLPVLSTDAPGCREFIRDGKDGLMVPRGNAREMADAMIRLLDDAALRSELSARSKRRAAEFSWEVIVKKYLALYGRLITDSKSNREQR